MKLASLCLLGLGGIASSFPAPHPRAEDSNTTACDQQCKQDALAFAYMYGYPLYAFAQLALATSDASTPTNFPLPQRGLQSAQNKAVVRPNADTLYTTIFIDLSEDDLEITVPDFGDRFGVFPFYDIYGNNFANIGSNANVTSGKIHVCYDHDNVGTFAGGIEGGYDGSVGMPTPYGIVLARIVTDNSTDDLEIVHALQDQITVKAIPRDGDAVAPQLNLSKFADPYYSPGNGTLVAESVMRLTAAISPYSQPEVASDQEWVAQTLANAGIKDGKWTQPPGTNLTAATATANESVTALLQTPGTLENLTNNWFVYDHSIIGDFRSHYDARYLITLWGYLVLDSDQAVYPSISGYDSIAADKAFLFQFSSRPVLKEHSFWSLTVYGADEFFVANDLNRYALGDRSNLTFPDGSLVYPGGEEGAEDGPFKILLQPADVTPPANWTSNWLPAPSGGGNLSFTLRFYGAEDAMTKGGLWEYPKVSIIDAIRA